MNFKKCRLVSSSLRKLEYDYNPVEGPVNMQIKTGANAKVPIGDLSKPCIVEQMIEITAENGSMNLKCIAVFFFKVDGTGEDYDVEELRNYVLENGNPIAYKKMTEIVKSVTGFSNQNPLVLPTYQTVSKSKDESN
ncbi:hypothetical protein MmiAt1_09290 [Methanimicrococcus sp. At1]|uniref:Uncharacterized protein n=1 Tax=Methanimicrococcus hacksteinii TaxID=3028293 RepID=A0ABU3VPL3_9EURY|nr:hypothetical protein [Methanimicrococcus sp. At1]MDV0445354.1 hypothetical protein [Methanimicrococcus sp. At1]